MEQGKHYYAFISHSSKDEKIAHWLRNQLVNYNIPVSVQKQYKAPQKLRPVFVYQTDLAGNVLHDALDNELKDSQFLIVICSPSAAKSKYVNNEVQHFIDTGRADKIIPFIIAGSPHAKNPDEVCFPPALLNSPVDLRGTDFKDLTKRLGSKKAAVVNVIAAMLGVRFDTLWDMHKRKQRKRVILSSFLALLLAGLVLFVWDYSRPIHKYFADFVECRGVPEGIIPLSKEEVSKREVSYCFTYKKLSFFKSERYLTEVMCINSYGYPRIGYGLLEEGFLKNENPIIKINYNDHFLVKSVVFYDVNRNPQKEYEYTSINTTNNKNSFIADIKFYSQSDNALIPNIEERPSKAQVRRCYYVTDSIGYIKKITYHAHNGNLKESITQNGDGVYGFVIESDSLHRFTATCAIDKDGNLMNKTNFNSPSYGVSVHKLSYDDYSNIVQTEYYNKNWQPIKCGWGYYKLVSSFDSDNNLIETVVYDEFNQRCVCKDGYSMERHKYKNGCCIEDVLFDEFDNRTIDTTYLASKIIRVFDERGNRIKVYYYDTEDNPTNCKLGYHYEEYSFNKKNMPVKLSIYDTGLNPTLSKLTLSSKMVVKRDSKGREIELVNYDIHGNRSIAKDGVCMTRKKYGQTGEVQLLEYFDENGNYTNCTDGYAIFKTNVFLDDDGNQSFEIAFFGRDNEKVFDKGTKTHKIVMVSDSNGNIIQLSCYGIDDLLCENSMGFAVVEYDYNSEGKIELAKYYNTNMELSPNLYGCVIDSLSYPSDNTTILFHKDANHKLCYSSDEVAVIKTEYSGDTVYTSFFDTLNNPCLNMNLYSSSIEIRNRMKMPVEGYFLGVDSLPTLRFDSIAGARFFYDKKGNCNRKEFLGKNGLLQNNTLGYSVVQIAFDERNRKIEETTFTDDSEDYVSQYICKYDEKDFPIELIERNNPNSNKKNTRTKTKYDSKGNAIEISFWNDNDEPTENDIGIHKMQAEYDKSNNVVKTFYYDCNDSLTLYLGQFAFVINEYNERHECIKASYYDTKEKMLGYKIIENNNYGFPIREKLYNEYDELLSDNIASLVVYTDMQDINENTMYLLLEFGIWNITKGLDNSFLKFFENRLMQKKRVIVMTMSGLITEMVVDENAKIDRCPVPVNVYYVALAQYKQWKTSSSN